jgi:hypothetical protein
MTTEAPSTPPATPPATTTPAAPGVTTPPSTTTEAPSALDAGWTPYVPDATKSANENLALKEAYDAKVPAGHDPNVKLEPKTAAPPADANKPPAKEGEQKPGLPPEIAFTDLVAPEGFTLEPGLSAEFVTTVNQHRGDPKGLANALLALNVKAQTQASEAASKGWETLQGDWKKQSEADPEIGGANYTKNTTAATEIGARFGGPKFHEALELTGMGNHPEWLRFISKTAPFLKEAAPLPPGGAPGQGGKATPTNLYPNQTK